MVNVISIVERVVNRDSEDKGSDWRQFWIRLNNGNENKNENDNGNENGNENRIEKKVNLFVWL